MCVVVVDGTVANFYSLIKRRQAFGEQLGMTVLIRGWGVFLGGGHTNGPIHVMRNNMSAEELIGPSPSHAFELVNCREVTFIAMTAIAAGVKALEDKKGGL